MAPLTWRKTWAHRMRSTSRHSSSGAWTNSWVPGTARKSPSIQRKSQLLKRERRQTGTWLLHPQHRAPENRGMSSWTAGEKTYSSRVLQPADMPLSTQGQSETFAHMHGFRWHICRRLQLIKTETSRQQEMKRSENSGISISDHMCSEISVQVTMHQAVGIYMI